MGDRHQAGGDRPGWAPLGPDLAAPVGQLAGRRLDEALATLAAVSRAQAQHWVAAGRVRVDGRLRPKGYRLAAAEVVAWAQPAPDRSGRPEPEQLDLVVRYEDEHLLVVAKPAGLVVHPGPGHCTGTLVNALLGRPGSRLSSVAGADRPGIVHRLDKDTSGLLLVAKDDATHRALTRQLTGRSIERRYLALVQGHPDSDGVVDAPIGRHPRDRTRFAVVPGGRPARTSLQAVEAFPGATLVEARLQTGRTHQIRVHLAYLRHPVVGDLGYGADPRLAANIGLHRPFLHAARLGFVRPADGRRIELEEPLPVELATALARLRGVS